MAHLEKALRLFDFPEDTMSANSSFKRVVLKLSGEALAGEQGYGVDSNVIKRFAKEIFEARQELEVEIAVVVGGGNIWRGAEHPEMDAAQSDYVGMMATVMNALVLQSALEEINQATRVMSAIRVEQVAELYIRRRAMRHLEKGRVVILAGGTGNPTFTTDTAAALRSVEIEADVLLMAKNGVDGVYTSDPKLDPNAVRYESLSHLDIISGGLRVMDSTAATHAREYSLPIIVFDGLKPGGFQEILTNPGLGTMIH